MEFEHLSPKKSPLRRRVLPIQVAELRRQLQDQQSRNLTLDMELQRSREHTKSAWILSSLKLQQTESELRAYIDDCKKTWTLDLHHMRLAVEVSKALEHISTLIDYEPLIARNLHPASKLKAVLENTFAEDTVVSEDLDSEAEQPKTDSGGRQLHSQTFSKDEGSTERTELDGKPLELSLFDLRHRISHFLKKTELQENRPVEDRLRLNFVSKDPPISMVMKLEQSGKASLPDSDRYSEDKLSDDSKEISTHVPAALDELNSKSPPDHQNSLFSFCSPDEKLASVQSLCTSGEEDSRSESQVPGSSFLCSNQSISNFTLGKSKSDQKPMSKGESLRGSLRGTLRPVKTQVAPLQDDSGPSLDVSMDLSDWVPERGKRQSVESEVEAPKPQRKRSVLELVCPCFGKKSAVRHR